MKLLHCLACQDVVRLFEEERACKCGKAKGRYVNGRDVVFEGAARVLGMNSLDFLRVKPGENAPWWPIAEGDHVKKKP